MNQKAAKKKKNKKPNKTKRSGLPVVEEEVVEEPLTFGDKVLAAVTPYIGTIVFALVAGFLAFALMTFWLRGLSDSKAFEWRELNSASSIARQTGDISQWNRVAETYPDSKAGLWASQFAGDWQLREGLSTLAADQEAGFGMIKKSKKYFQSVIDAPASAKTPTLEQASHFSLAYACESLGEFEESKALYQKLIDEAPDSAFAGNARRGLNRSTSDDYTELYAKFTNWQEEVIGEAPGARVPEAPSIDFPEVDLPPGQKPPATSGVTPSAGETGTAAKADVNNDFPAKDSTGAAAKATIVQPSVETKPIEAAAEGKAVEVKDTGTAVVEAVEKVAEPVVTSTTEAVTEAAETAKPVVEAVTEAVKEAVTPTK